MEFFCGICLGIVMVLSAGGIFYPMGIKKGCKLQQQIDINNIKIFLKEHTVGRNPFDHYVFTSVDCDGKYTIDNKDIDKMCDYIKQNG